MTSFWKTIFHSDSANISQIVKPNWVMNEPWCGPQFDLVIMQFPEIKSITHLLNISSKRVLTVSGNGVLCVWDIEENCSKVMPHIHQNRVASIALISEYPHHTAQQCITAGCDKRIIVWSLVEMTQLIEINNGEHIVRSLLYFPSLNVFIAGSDVLQLWSMEGKLHDSVHNQFENEDVKFLLNIGDNKLICAFDKYLSAYRVSGVKLSKSDGNSKELDFLESEKEFIDDQYELIHVTKLPHHHEVIKAVIEANDSAFITASLDGAIILWTSFRLNFTKCFNMRQTYIDSTQRFSYSVQDVSVIDQSFILAAIGNGFSIFDINSGATLVEVEEAHDTKVTCARYLRWLDLVSTCAFDGRIRFWGFAKKQLVENRVTHSKRYPLGSSANVSKVFLRAPLSDVLKFSNRHNRNKSYQIVCYHELLGHEDQVVDLISMDVKGFLTYGKENCIFFWRNRDHFENELLNKIQSIF